MRAISEGSGETVRMRRLVRAFAVCICDQYQTLKDWLKNLTYGTVVPTKSDSDVIVCLQSLSKTLTYTPLELTRIDISLVY